METLTNTGDINSLLAWAFVIVLVTFAARTVLGAALAVLGHLPGTVGFLCRRAGAVVTPRLIRRCAVALLGIASTAGFALPAHAGGPVELASYDRVIDSPTPGEASRPAQHRITVAPGDTLWSLAAKQLPITTPGVAIDRQWRLWYAANRAKIGADPDVISTGMVLTVPAVRAR